MKIALDADVIKGFVNNFLIDGYQDREPIPQFHIDWWKLYTSSAKNVMIAAPRSHAKSTALNHAYGLAIGLFQNHPFQFKVSRTYDLAVEKLQQAKTTLVDNEKIKAIFGFKNLEKDTENDFVAVFNDGYRMRMFALGMEQKVRGKSWGTIRPSAIICDDAEDDEQVESLNRREKAMKWFMRVLMPIGGRNTINRVTGTVLHQDSILMRLMKMEDWVCRVDQACDEEISEASILWPQMFPKSRLETIKKSYVDAGDLPGYNMEYRNQSADRSSGLFREEDFRSLPEDLDRSKLTYYCGMDFAISEDKRRDYTAIVVAGMDAEGTLYILDVQRGRWGDGNEIIDQMFLIEEAYHPAEWFAEEGMISKALGAALELRMREANGGQGIFLNITPMKATASKRVRAANIRARVRGKAVRFDREASWFPAFEEELLQFDRGTHDDQCLTGDTEISMADGSEKQLRDVVVGDWVSTPYGPCPVMASGMTQADAEIYCIDIGKGAGRQLCGTANHPVWSNGWKNLAKLMSKDKILHVSASTNGESSCQESTVKQSFRRKLSSTGLLTVVTLKPSERIYDATFHAAEVVASCIGIYGDFISERFHKAATFITEMGTGLTTPLATSFACQDQNISTNIGQTASDTTRVSNAENILSGYGQRRLLGIVVLKVAHGISRMASVLGKIARCSNDAANNVRSRLSLRSNERDFAASRAKLAVGVHEREIISVRKLPLRRPVYNISVWGAKCYFADGILVHNCDAFAHLGMGLARMVIPLTDEEEEDFRARHCAPRVHEFWPQCDNRLF